VVIVDSSVWVDYFRAKSTAQTDWLEREVARQRLGITDIILCEVLQGVRDDHRFVATRKELLKCHVFETGGVPLAIEAAERYRTLRRRGHTVRKTIDCLIATFCLRHGHSLLHADSNFDPFEQLLDLSVVHP
jgi:predicted nucleic acid-binding protein